ncbi:MAG: DNA recombination protein RmuC [Thermodesulfobacteriota bacterium]
MDIPSLPPWTLVALLPLLLFFIISLRSLALRLAVSQGQVRQLGQEAAIAMTRAEGSEEAWQLRQQDLETRMAGLRAEKQGLQAEISSLHREQSASQSELAALKAQAQEERKGAAEKIRLLEAAETKMAKEFELLANRIFEEKQQRFTTANQTSMEALLAPMRQQLSDFRHKVDDVYDRENRERASLKAELTQLRSLNERIGSDALNLTRALKGDAKLRGNWGEMQLERLLEESGLSKGREYEVQVNLSDRHGQRLQPDVVVHLPEKKDVIIDAKVSLIAYEEYHASESESKQAASLKGHIASLRRHFQELSNKNYDELLGVNSLDLVIMFVPIEPALLLAFEHEPSLFSQAFKERILLVSPSTLMATLQIIGNIWRHEDQNRNAVQIATSAGRLHDQFVLFSQALEDVGNKLDRARESYATAHKRLVSGRGNLVGRTKQLETLGAKTRKKLASQLLAEAGQQEDAPLAKQLIS